MAKNPLHIVSVENESSPQPPSSSSKRSRREETQAKFERLWLQAPEQFDPERNCMEKNRIERTWNLLQTHGDLKELKAVDLGCGSGTFSRLLRDAGAHVDAVDVAQNALKRFEGIDSTDINLVRDFVPKTLLEDSAYDRVVAMDLIAYLDPAEYRLFFAELARLVKNDGLVLCSTPIDIYSDDALQQFADLAATEFVAQEWAFSYHLLYITLKNFFLAPSRYFKAFRDKKYRAEAIEKRYTLNKLWFRVNSTFVPAMVWGIVQYAAKPFVWMLDNSVGVLLLLEKITHFVWSERGISHAAFIGNLRPLSPHVSKEEQPRELKHKRQVWE